MFRRRDILPPAALSVAVMLYGCLAVGSMRLKSPTVDEKIHLAAGFADIVTGDFRMDPEHPPLLKCWAAVPLLFTDAVAPVQHKAWEKSDTIGFGRVFLYYANPDPEKLLFPARLAMVFLNGMLIFVVYAWSKRLWGNSAAVLAAVLTALNPNFIAHARLVTTDAGTALFSVLLLYALYTGSDDRWSSNLVQGLLLGLALLSKYSALIWLPWVAGVLLLRGKRRFKRAVLSVLIVFGAAFFVVWAGYAGSPPWVEYRRGFLLLHRRMASGHPAYLFGDVSKNGWYFYFPVVLALKTPIHILFLWALSGYVLLKKRETRHKATAVLLPALWFLLIASLSRHDIGVRHVLPVYPLMSILASGIMTHTAWNRFARFCVGITAMVLSLTEAVSVFPDYIPYFNILAGGRDGGYRYLSDSNLDWGQDLKLVERYLKKVELPEPIYIDYFGDVDLVRKRLPYLKPVTPVEEYKPTAGTFIVSIFKLQNIWAPSETRYAWLKQFNPSAIIGGSIRVYTPDVIHNAPESLRRTYMVHTWGEPIDKEELDRFLRSGWKHVDPFGDWVFPPNPNGDTLRAVSRKPTVCFALPSHIHGKEVALTADFLYLPCLPDERQSIDIFCNNVELREITCSGIWSRQTVILPSGVLGNGVNLLEFVAGKYVFPEKACPPDYHIGTTGTVSPVPLFLRCGRAGKAVYRDMIVGPQRVEIPEGGGIFCAALLDNGTVSSSFAIRKDVPKIDDIALFHKWIASLETGTIVLFLERYPESEISSKMNKAAKEKLRSCRLCLGMLPDYHVDKAKYHISIGVTGATPGSVPERWGNTPIFLAVGENADTKPYAFGIKSVIFQGMNGNNHRKAIK